jgi:hypothetical protein
MKQTKPVYGRVRELSEAERERISLSYKFNEIGFTISFVN